MTVDDQAVFRQAAREVIEATDGFEHLGEAGSGEEALALAGELDPDLVLVDVRMPGIDGFETARRLSAAHPASTVVLISTECLDEDQSGTSCSARRRSCGSRTSGLRCSDGCGATTADVRSPLKGSTRSQPLRPSEPEWATGPTRCVAASATGMFARTVVPRPGVDSTTRVPPSAAIRSDMFASP